MHTLVVTASKHGATAEIGLLIADTLNAAGITTTARPVEAVVGLDGYDAVVLGSAVYMGRWLEQARRLVNRMPGAFAARDVWLFSSGPLGDPPIPVVEPDDAEAMVAQTHAHEHRTFAGRLVRRDLRFGEKAITKVVGAPDGDFIPREEIRAWAEGIARTLLERDPLARPTAVSGPDPTPLSLRGQ